MPNRNYLKGKRLEKDTEAWLQLLDPECKRSFMSRGADLLFRWLRRLWKGSCKSGKRGTISLAKIRKELEDYDFCVTKESYVDPFPMFHIYAPKFAEMLGIAEQEDWDAINGVKE